MDWDTRLAVSFQIGEQAEEEITPIDSFSPTFAMNSEPLHSIEATHIGVIHSPDQITFTMTVKAMGTATARLTQLALRGDRFNIVLQEADSRTGGDDWSFVKIVLGDCIITSAAPTAASPTGVPTATFSGYSLNASVEPSPSSLGPGSVSIP